MYRWGSAAEAMAAAYASQAAAEQMAAAYQAQVIAAHAAEQQKAAVIADDFVCIDGVWQEPPKSRLLTKG